MGPEAKGLFYGVCCLWWCYKICEYIESRTPDTGCLKKNKTREMY